MSGGWKFINCGLKSLKYSFLGYCLITVILFLTCIFKCFCLEIKVSLPFFFIALPFLGDVSAFCYSLSSFSSLSDLCLCYCSNSLVAFVFHWLCYMLLTHILCNETVRKMFVFKLHCWSHLPGCPNHFACVQISSIFKAAWKMRKILALKHIFAKLQDQMCHLF